MNINEWITKINSVNNNFLINNPDLVNFINLTKSKYLCYQQINLPQSGHKLLSNKDYTLIWDCEFQVLKKPKYINSKLLITEFLDTEVVRCISELGLILLININKQIYIAGLFHLGFLNNRFDNSLDNYLPFYNEYMSVLSHNKNKIINLEKKIYPHLILESMWSNFKKNKDATMLSKSLINLTKHFLVKSNKSILFKLKTLLNELIEYLEVNNMSESENIIKKVIVALKSLIYLKLIKSYNKKVQFEQIMKIYFEDKYIKSILVDVYNHNMVISSFYNLVINNRGINIIKGGEDIKAIINHYYMLNYKTYNSSYKIQDIKSIIRSINIIDIAEYNSEIYKKCGSAKLLESYECLINDKNYIHEESNKVSTKILNKFMDNEIRAHNPLVDAYYTLNVFVMFNN